MLLLVFLRGEPSGEPNTLWVALFRNSINLWAPGIRQTQHPSDLVKGFAGGVIDGLTQQLDVAHQVSHQQQRGVTTRHQ